MDLKDLAGKILPFAQVLGSAIGGPVGLATTAAISLAKAFGLGSDATPDQIDEAIQKDPQAALKFRLAEMDFQLALNKQRLDEIEMQDKDRQNARQREIEITKATGKRDVSAEVLDWIIISGFFGILAVGIFKGLGGGDTNVSLMVGAMISAFTTVINYKRGSSEGSRLKTELMMAKTKGQ